MEIAWELTWLALEGNWTQKRGGCSWQRVGRCSGWRGTLPSPPACEPPSGLKGLPPARPGMAALLMEGESLA